MFIGGDSNWLFVAPPPPREPDVVCTLAPRDGDPHVGLLGDVTQLGRAGKVLLGGGEVLQGRAGKVLQGGGEVLQGRAGVL